MICKFLEPDTKHKNTRTETQMLVNNCISTFKWNGTSNILFYKLLYSFYWDKNSVYIQIKIKTVFYI